MSVKQVMKKTLAAALALPVLVLAAAGAFAGNPPTGAERIIGPPIEGVLVIDNGLAKFVGQCKKQAVLLVFQYAGDIANVTAADLMNVRVDGAAPAGCFSEFGGENLIVTGVQKFTNYTTPTASFLFPAIGAELQISVVEAK
jgi:hypothetical protein